MVGLRLIRRRLFGLPNRGIWDFENEGVRAIIDSLSTQ